MALSPNILKLIAGKSFRLDEKKDEVQRSIDNYTTRLDAVGAQPKKPTEGLFVKLMKNVARTGYAATNVIREFTNTQGGATPGVIDPIKAYGRGLSLKETPIGRDVMTDLGVDDTKSILGGEKKWYKGSAAGTLGLLLDIFNPLDVLNWTSFGLGKASVKGLTGTKALAKSFGSKADDIAKALGKVDDLGADTVGKLMAQVTAKAGKSGLADDALTGLIKSMRDGLAETGLGVEAKLPFSMQKPITVGLQNPLSLGKLQIGKVKIPLPGKDIPGTFVAIPGTKPIVGAITKGVNLFKGSNTGNALGKLFSTKHIPTEMPDTVLIRQMARRDLNATIRGVETGMNVSVPSTLDELKKLYTELDQIELDFKFDPKTGEGTYSSFESIAEATKVDKEVLANLFADDFPFTNNIDELYQSLKTSSTLPDSELYKQAARLRKTMDIMASQIPDELLPFFKGTMEVPVPVGAAMKTPDLTAIETIKQSPLLSYRFSFNGIDIMVGMNSSKTFNDNIWVKLGGVIQGIDGIPPENLKLLKKYTQIAPMNLTDIEGMEVRGATFGDDIIVIGDPKKAVFQHEYGHVLSNERVNMGIWEDLINQDGGKYVSDYAANVAIGEREVEDFADSFVQFIEDNQAFTEQYPKRALYMENLIENTKISPSELDEILDAQKERARFMAELEPAEAELLHTMEAVDNKLMEHLDEIEFVPGSEVYQTLRDEMTKMFEQITPKVEDFTLQVEHIFKDTPLKERKLIMEMAAGGYTAGISSPAYLKNLNSDFFTKTEKMVMPKMSNSMPVEDFNKLLQAQGVKADEVKWLGLEEMTKGKTVITKAEVEEWVKMNNLEVQEVKYGGPIPEMPDGGPEYLNQTLPGGEDYREILITLPSIEGKGFKSSHWLGEKNVVAHTRFNTRYDAAGKKVLFIEEIQSDWHQAGRKKGYATKFDDPTTQALADEWNKIEAEFEHGDLRDIHDNAKFERLLNRQDELVLELNELGVTTQQLKGGVPEAPFEKTWPDFVQKRMLKYAVDNGFEGVAWTTGAQQNKRYNITQVTDRVMYNETNSIFRAMKNGHVVTEMKIKPTELADHVGEEIADRLLKQPVIDDTHLFTGYKSLDGLDLEVGGSGMKGFYDQILPSKTNKIVKQFGGKVENINLSKNIQKGLSKVEAHDLLVSFKEGYTSFIIDNGIASKIKELGLEGLEQQPAILFDSIESFLYSRVPSLKGRIPEIEIDDIFSHSIGTIEDILDTEIYDEFVEVWEKFHIEYGVEDIFKVGKAMNQPGYKITDDMKTRLPVEKQPMFQKGAGVDNPSGLTPEGDTALANFIAWRESIVKTYRKLGIPINEIEKYVPFIPIRTLSVSEKAAVNAVFGTGDKTLENVDAFVEFLSETDPNLKPRTTKATSPATVNELLGKEWLTEDAAVAMALRGTRAIKATELATFLQGFIQKYGISYDDLLRSAGGKIPQGYKMFMVGTEGNGRKVLQEVFDPANAAKKAKNTFFIPDEMAKVYNDYSEMIFHSQAKNPVLKIYDDITSAYKKVAYLWNPGHVPRDFFGNVWNGFLMGVTDPREYYSTLKALMKPDTTMIQLPSGPILAKDLIRQASDMGVLEVGQSMADTPRGLAEKLNIKGKNPATRALGSYSHIMREGTRKSDMYTRLTGLIHELKLGKSMEEAATQVKKFYFDYFDLTNFERKVMKRVMPFYTWTRKNIPLQIEQFFKNPRDFARLQSLVSSAEGEAVDWEKRPEYVAESAAFKLGENYVAPNMPYQDIARVPVDLKGVLQFLAGVNPIIRAPLEAATNTQWFTGRNIEEYAGEQREIPLGGLLKMLGNTNVPKISKRTLGHLVDQIPILRNIDIMTNPDSNRRVSRFSSFAGGPSLYDAKGVRNSAQYEQLRILQDLLRKLQDDGVEVPTLAEIQQARENK